MPHQPPMEPEAISSIRTKVKWQKISICKCEKLLPFDVKTFCHLDILWQCLSLRFVLIASGGSFCKTFSHQMAKVFHISTFALIEEMASALSPYREL